MACPGPPYQGLYESDHNVVVYDANGVPISYSNPFPVYVVNGGGGGGNPNMTTATFTLPPDSVAYAVDTLTTDATHRTCKWIVSLLENVSMDAEMFEVLAISRGTVNPPSFMKYAQTGDRFNIAYNVTSTATTLTLVLTNHGPAPLVAELVKIAY